MLIIAGSKDKKFEKIRDRFRQQAGDIKDKKDELKEYGGRDPRTIWSTAGLKARRLDKELNALQSKLNIGPRKDGMYFPDSKDIQGRALESLKRQASNGLLLNVPVFYFGPVTSEEIATIPDRKDRPARLPNRDLVDMDAKHHFTNFRHFVGYTRVGRAMEKINRRYGQDTVPQYVEPVNKGADQSGQDVEGEFVT